MFFVSISEKTQLLFTKQQINPSMINSIFYIS